MAKARGTTKTKPGASVAEAIEAKRREGLSWKAVAEALGLKTPGAARKAYTDATGKSHNDIEGVEVKVAPRKPRTNGDGAAPATKARKVVDRNPHWNADSDQDEVIKALEPIYDTRPGGARELTDAATVRTRIVMAKAGDYVFEQDHTISRLIGLKWSKDERDLLVEFHDAYSGNYHCVRIQDIVEVTR